MRRTFLIIDIACFTIHIVIKQFSIWDLPLGILSGNLKYPSQTDSRTIL
jgi:hypothetical protein